MYVRMLCMCVNMYVCVLCMYVCLSGLKRFSLGHRRFGANRRITAARSEAGPPGGKPCSHACHSSLSVYDLRSSSEYWKPQSPLRNQSEKNVRGACTIPRQACDILARQTSPG